MPPSPYSEHFLQQLADQTKTWGRELGFQQVGIADIELSQEQQRLRQWLHKGYQGDMQWLGEHGDKRSRPEKLLPGTQRVICARLDYLPADTEQIRILKQPDKAYVSRYALGRDYHKLIRKRLSQLARKIELAAGDYLQQQSADDTGETVQQRAFVDSAPVLERPLAAKAGLGWVGKHTLLLNSQAGSWFFLGEVYTNLPLPIDTELERDQCGDCQACLKVCPTDAFPRPYELDARRCISYLTIEHKGAIPVEFREPMGNRVFGCDDCQAICPWNKYASFTTESDFSPRHKLDQAELTTLFDWDETTFLTNTEGSAIRRIGYERWLRNLAVGLGNADDSESAVNSLQQKLDYPSALVREHVQWALRKHQQPRRRRQRKIKNPHKAV
ncbi:tRNA epoxyqueuosine(34) reductase QueG [Pseudomaricurvus alkylphenolicus]|uniref:tRNA epoxyqueuosine(34) reductase QueG n=1 Tax=Pseudomaricurvus alkylphenolicus TaxID=1306991 RepID=UPI00141DB55D|nr:tRNA epoxyqueuosine(34) reductase QueG [Pseudomaricurvus alkylphenolicus]NIB39329.1 tRNA epoxyqueuosine(34) reductase QueG [Pseudomaricurvus alkylphenolicus]